MKRFFGLILTLCILCSISTTGLAIDNNSPISEKREFYEQCQMAIKDAMEKYAIEVDLTPFEDFNFSNAMSIDELKIELEAFGKYQMNNPITPLSKNAKTPEQWEEERRKREPILESYQRVTHNDTVTAGTRTITIDITGEFKTYYSDTHNRQLFSGDSKITDIKSKTSGYTWHTTAKDCRIIDGGRTYYVVAQGDVKYGDMVWRNLRISTEFYCNANGRVS